MTGTRQAKATVLANFRDAGGLPAARRPPDPVRPAVPQRTACRNSATTHIANLVDRLGIRYIIDLRTAEESVQQGRGPLDSYPIGYLNVPLVDVDAPACAG